MLSMPEREFETLVGEALDSIPPELLALLDNVVIRVEDIDPADARLLGVYQGTALTERTGDYAFELPDTITVFRLPILRLCRDLDEVRREVAITVVHELGHHFGIDDDRLHQLGWA
jgi:predicted Zn-dependent protease with MMP-like domain